MPPHSRVATTAGALCALVLASLVAGSGPAVGAELPKLQRSVVRIVNYWQRANWYTPWDVPHGGQGSGSGFVVGGGLLMTNAHVVSDARLLLIYLHGDPTPHRAVVRHIAHDSDLALLAPVEPDLLEGVPALRFGGLPALGSSVETYGYPGGGRQIASTRGVVSRIDVELYTHSGADSHLAVQTDAAINPGNSGGPVIQDGAVVGVAFQAAPDLENVGFFIPAEVVEHFLVDVRDGVYDGYPVFGALHSSLESPAARRKAGLAAGESGVIVDHVFPGSSADGRVRPGDVILEIAGHPVANDGTVEREGLRLDLGVLLDAVQVGEAVRVRLLRNGERKTLDVAMRPYEPIRAFANVYDRLPRYYVYAGLVFVPLNREMLKTFGDSWGSVAERHLLYEYYLRVFREPETVEKESVVLLRRLDHPVNANGAWSSNLVVDRVNGREIDSLEDLIAAIEENREPYHTLDFAYYGRFLALDREEADAANAGILDRYGVPEDRRL